MMSVTRRRLLATAGAAAAGGVLAACRGAGRPAQQVGTPSIGPTTLEHMDWWVPDQSQLHAQYFEGLAKELQEKYPQITVKYVFVAGTGGGREKWIVLSA